MLVGALLGDHGFYQDTKAGWVATALGLHEIEKKVCARHLPPPSVAYCHLA